MKHKKVNKKKGINRWIDVQKLKDKLNLLAFLRRLGLRIKKFLISFDFIHWYWFLSKNKKEFKSITQQNVRDFSEKILEGIGGGKNITKIEKTINSVSIFFKSRYFFREDVIKECGGLSIEIDDNEKKLFMVFGNKETKGIAKNLKKEMQRCKSNYTAMDIE